MTTILSRSIALLLFCALTACGGADQVEAAPISVSLVIDLPVGDDPILTGLPAGAGDTIFDVMQTAATNGMIVFTSSGRGETAFVSSLMGLENGGASGRNWLYCVNGVLGEVGFGAHKLIDGDEILWSYADYPWDCTRSALA